MYVLVLYDYMAVQRIQLFCQGYKDSEYCAVTQTRRHFKKLFYHQHTNSNYA